MATAGLVADTLSAETCGLGANPTAPAIGGVARARVTLQPFDVMLVTKGEEVSVLVGHAGLFRGYRNVSAVLRVACIAPAVSIAVCLVRVEVLWAIIQSVRYIIPICIAIRTIGRSYVNVAR